MKFFAKATLHFIAAIFLYLLIGTALSTLMIQSKFLDMRFDSEFVITIAVLAGLWHYFARVFMNAHSLSLWEKKKASSIVGIISLAVILIIHFMNGSLSIMPAYMVRMALFMENVISLSGMNILLIVVSDHRNYFANNGAKKPTNRKKQPKDGLEQATCFKQVWNDLSIWSIGIVFAFVYRAGVSSGLS